MLHDTILSLLGKPTRLDTARQHVRNSHANRRELVGTWRCMCGHRNLVYHIYDYLHPLGTMACARSDCGLTWHPSLHPIVPHDRSDLVVAVRVPDPQKPSQGNAPYILSRPKKSVLRNFEDTACPTGYGYVCLNEKCGLSWATKVVKEWPWGSGRKVLAVAGRCWKSSCLCGRRVQVGGGFAVFEIVRREKDG